MSSRWSRSRGQGHLQARRNAKPKADYGRPPLISSTSTTTGSSTFQSREPDPDTGTVVSFAATGGESTSTAVSNIDHHSFSKQSPLSSGHMAPGLPVVITTPDDDHKFEDNHHYYRTADSSASFVFTLDDCGSDSSGVPGLAGATDSAFIDSQPTTIARDSPASTLTTPSFLHPHHNPNNFLRPPTPEEVAFGMGFQDEPASDGANAPAPAKNPFNFQTQTIATGPVKSNIGQRRGHRYKHSSISAQHSFFQEPPPRPPPVLPASLPIPTFKEAWASMQRDQRARLWWCCCHAAVAVYVFFSSESSLAMTALSHLVFFDVGSAAVCVAVDVLGNFEVWRRSSIRHPFGLQRAEVLAGFAMSVFLVFGGFDLISHNLKHVLETVGSHAPHHPHAAEQHGGHSHSHAHGADGEPLVNPGTIDLASLAAVVSTLISAYGLRNHGRIRRVMRVPLPYLGKLIPGAGILANPFHFLTLFFAFLMLLLPLVSVGYFVWLDRLICAAIAASMFVLGSRLAVAQGLMLLMSYSGERVTPTASSSSSSNNGSAGISSSRKSDDNKVVGSTSNNNSSVSAVVREIEAEPQVARVEEAQFWQVHYGLAMANLKVCLRGGNSPDDGTLSQLRSKLVRLVQNRLGEGYGRGSNLRWEVTVQMSTEGN